MESLPCQLPPPGRRTGLVEPPPLVLGGERVGPEDRGAALGALLGAAPGARTVGLRVGALTVGILAGAEVGARALGALDP